MSEKLETFKKKLLYRASYRGTKEMDILLSAFVKKNIDNLNYDQLVHLESFLKLEDEIILNYYNFGIINRDIKKTQFLKIFKDFNLMAERVGFEPTNELPRCWFSRPVLSTAQPPLRMNNALYLLLSKP